tara:strand:- start:1459 stop:2178 length:720 start_codon:yes stop_codon:yes gene_type:complete
MSKPIKALLLAAGLGTRLRPMTLTTPKCLIKINNKPILEHWLDKLEDVQVGSVLINTHYLNQQVEDFLIKQCKRSIKIKQFNEIKLLGTAGTLLANKQFFNESTGLLIHADNYTNINLDGLIKAHRNKPSNCLLTMLTFDSKNPKNCGIVEVDSNGIMKEFHEKVGKPPGEKANGAIYVFDSDFLKFLNNCMPNAKDFSTEVIPSLKGLIYTWHTNKPFIDIGSPETLAEAENLAKELI